jgi:uncharacterized protein (DUF952 family)
MASDFFDFYLISLTEFAAFGSLPYFLGRNDGATMRIYKLLRSDEWAAAQVTGLLRGSETDKRDGFIHLSTAEQVAETARKHFSGITPLYLATIYEAALGAALRYEPSRGGALFPHYYGVIPLSAIEHIDRVPLGSDGHHDFTGLLT